MVFDHINGRITEVSQKVIDIINETDKTLKSGKDFDLNDNSIYIDDIVDSFHTEGYLEMRQWRKENNFELENVYTINLSPFLNITS